MIDKFWQRTISVILNLHYGFTKYNYRIQSVPSVFFVLSVSAGGKRKFKSDSKTLIKFMFIKDLKYFNQQRYCQLPPPWKT